MKILTIEQLAGYLPYGLTFLSHKHRIKYNEQTVLTARGMSLTDDGDLVIEFLYDDDLIFSNEMKTCTPLLRQLSDLTKPIKDAQGETVTPLIEMFKMVVGSDECKITIPYKNRFVTENYMARFVFDAGNNGYASMCFLYETMGEEGDNWNPSFNQLALFQYLYKNHFDLHGLLENGLAIKIED